MAKNMADYLSPVAADYDGPALDIPPYNMVFEEGQKEQVPHRFSNGKRGIVTLSSDSQHTVTVQYRRLTTAQDEQIIDLFHNTAKANGLARSWYLDHASDGHTYTVKFLEPLGREWRPRVSNRTGVRQIRLEVLGVMP